MRTTGQTGTTKAGPLSTWLRRLTTPVVLSVAVVGALVTVGGSSGSRDRALLISGTNFTITTPTPGPLLYPGAAPSPFPITITNPLSAAITVTSLTITLTTTMPADCPASSLAVNAIAFTAPANAVTLTPSFIVAPNSGGTLTPTTTLALADTHQNQNACKNLALAFTYSGTATYTQVFATKTALASSATPSTYGQSVTFTATVTPTGTPPSPPTGSVTFYDGTTSLGSAAVNAAAQAQLITTGLKGGTHALTAVFTNTDGNFTTSTSPALSQQVNKAARSNTLGSSANPSVFGQSVTFADTVAASTPPLVNPTGTITFSDGINALATVPVNAAGQAQYSTSSLGGGAHAITAAYSGDTNFAASTSNTITQQVNFTQDCITSKYNNSLTVLTGQAICITSTGSVNGNITVNSGGSLSDMGGSVNGNITSTGATAITVCGVNKVNGSVIIQNSSGFVLIGDNGDDGSPSCAGNTINSNVTLSGNTAGVEIGANSINGTLTVTSNTGVGVRAEDRAPEIEQNSISGSLSCSTNTPAPINDGQPNTAKGSRTGQCAASGF